MKCKRREPRIQGRTKVGDSEMVNAKSMVSIDKWIGLKKYLNVLNGVHANVVRVVYTLRVQRCLRVFLFDVKYQ